jgi:hypothetical protein
MIRDRLRRLADHFKRTARLIMDAYPDQGQSEALSSKSK